MGTAHMKITVVVCFCIKSSVKQLSGVSAATATGVTVSWAKNTVREIVSGCSVNYACS